MSQQVPLTLRIEMAVWATPAEGVSLEDLVERMRALGNPVLEIDREANRILVAYVKE